jgi:hypothetical protein
LKELIDSVSFTIRHRLPSHQPQRRFEQVFASH